MLLLRGLHLKIPILGTLKCDSMLQDEDFLKRRLKHAKVTKVELERLFEE